MGVFVVILTKGTIDGSIEMLIGNSIRLSSGHVRIIDREYQVKERLLSLNYPVDGFGGEGYRAMVEVLGSIDSVENVVPRLRFGAMVSKGAELEGVMAMGVDPEPEDKLVGFSRYLSDGRFLQPGERGAVMGYRTLDKLGLDVGDKFTLVFNTALGSLKGYTFTVVGSVKSGVQYLDDGLVFVPLDVAQDMLDMGPAVTEILVMAKDEAQVPGMSREIQQMLRARGADTRYLAEPWYQHGEMFRALETAKGAYNLVYFFILFLASFVVVNTMVMIINERRREIGMMSALGLRPDEIRQLFMCEGGVMGVLGSFIGVLAGAGVLKVLSVAGIAMPGTSSIDKAFMMPPKLYPEFSLEVIGFAFLAGI
ncbi:MAG: FtsX-like permease family protein, partial [Bacillota bacterium]